MNYNFLDNFNHKLDTKNRVSIPASYRQWTNEEQAGFVMSIGVEKCIIIYPAQKWNEFENNLTSKLRKTNPDHRIFLRRFTSNTSKVKCDKQGRISIPNKFLDFAQIKDNVKIVGVGDTFELWNPENYDRIDDNIDFSDDLYTEIESSL